MRMASILPMVDVAEVAATMVDRVVHGFGGVDTLSNEEMATTGARLLAEQQQQQKDGN